MLGASLSATPPGSPLRGPGRCAHTCVHLSFPSYAVRCFHLGCCSQQRHHESLGVPAVPLPYAQLCSVHFFLLRSRTPCPSSRVFAASCFDFTVKFFHVRHRRTSVAHLGCELIVLDSTLERVVSPTDVSSSRRRATFPTALVIAPNFDSYPLRIFVASA